MSPKGRRLKRYLGLRRGPTTAHKGGIEHLMPGRITGWVVGTKAQLLEVRLLVGPHLIARAEVNLPRPDVCQSLGWQGAPGFELILPAELPPLDWKPSPRLLALSADGSQAVQLDLLVQPEQTETLLQALLQSDLLGLEGHCDGLLQGAIRGWAGRRGQHQSAQIWLQAEGQDPWPVTCDQWRDGMQAMGLPSLSGFSIEPGSLPRSWAGRDVWFSFDRQGQFRLPQSETIRLPSSGQIASPVIPLTEGKAIVNVIAGEAYPLALKDVPEDLRDHWQSLQQFSLQLDKLEEHLVEIERSRQIPPQDSGRSGWWRRLLGSGKGS